MTNVNERNPVSKSKDGLFLFLSFVVSFIFVQFVLYPFNPQLSMGVAIFYIALHVCAAFYLRGSKMIFSKLSILTLIPVAALIITFLVYNNNSLFFLVNLLALWFASSLNLLVAAGLEPYPFSSKTIGDVFKVTFYLPFAEISKRISSFFSTKSKKFGKNFLIVFLTVIAITPAIIVVLLLLSSSDPNFGSFLDKIINLISAELLTYILKAIIAIILTFPLFNLLYKLKNNLPEVKVALNKTKEGRRKLNSICSTAALFCFNLIYVLYIAVQASYLFSALFGILPKNFTFADYARQGFFELTVVVAFNLLLLFSVYTFTKRPSDKLPPFCRALSILMVLTTILLIVTALSKMFLYIGNYGLTQLRVYTAWFMVVLLFICVYLLIKFASPKFKFTQFCTTTVVVLFIILNLSNVDGLIANYNIAQYNKTGKLDTSLLFELSDSAIPSISRLRSDKTYGSEIENYLGVRRYAIEKTSFESKSLSQYFVYHFYLKDVHYASFIK